jgi:hypothetical protein
MKVLREAKQLQCLLAFALVFSAPTVFAVEQTKGSFVDKFRQLETELPTPNMFRNAAGEPAPAYWQQEASYEIDIHLDEENRSARGSESIRYQNNSPGRLKYLWLQLDQNRFHRNSMDSLTRTVDDPGKLTYSGLRNLQFIDEFDGGFNITAVRDANGKPLPHTITGTLMRIDLPQALGSGKSIRFSIDWNYRLVDSEAAYSQRDGYEHFPGDGNDIFLMAQWYPRMVAYSDYEAWHNKEFIGRGEFTLEFGDFNVRITVPADHVVSSTGELQNPAEVLTRIQRQRLKEARDAGKPVFIVTPDEALANESGRDSNTRTWHFVAENVRDFAFASSRKFIWDAQGYQQDDSDRPFVMAMSFYPKEGEPLWSQYSTQAVIHTMEVYSRYSFAYPYPVAQSVNGPAGGMEYPMITFNGPRTELQEDGSRTYSRSEKRFLIGVVIHEVGHTYFPMVVNSDERQWTWMDEGLNTFLQFIAEKEWDSDYPSRRGEPRWIVDFMKSEDQVPIMTNSESLLQFGNNAYAKPATALVILRETILGRELFDFAFREYATRWKFRRPTPADFFRTMEEASGVDLDWFWRGWFFSTDHVDISIDRVSRMKVDALDPEVKYPLDRQELADEPLSRTLKHNTEEGRPTRVERHPELLDFYDENDQFTVTNKDRNEFQEYLKSIRAPLDTDPEWRIKALQRAIEEDRNFYMIELSSPGGLVMPVILEITYTDESVEMIRIPAEIWRYSPGQVNKLIARDKEIASIVADPYWETADVDVSNNHYPRKFVPSRLEIFKDEDLQRKLPERDLMQDIRTELNTGDEEVPTRADATERE